MGNDCNSCDNCKLTDVKTLNSEVKQIGPKDKLTLDKFVDRRPSVRNTEF